MEFWIMLAAILAAASSLFWVVRLRDRLKSVEEQLLLAESSRRDLKQEVNELSAIRDALMKAINDVVLILNGKHQIIYANPQAETLLESKDLVGQSLIRATRHGELDKLARETKTSSNEAAEQIIELQGRSMHVRALCEDVYNHTFEIIVLHDITEMQRLGRARRDMVANISHELRTPITNIGLLTDTLLNGAISKPKRSKRMLNQIRQHLDILTQLVQEMRDLSLIESGQMPIKLTPNDLSIIVHNSVDPLMPMAERKDQTLEIDVPEDIEIFADQLHIQRVLKNIVQNAIKFVPEGGQISVKATTEDDEVTLAIKDNGPGISAEDLPRIFERFFQSNRARQDGTGLGLAIARHIIKGHGGRIWAESVEGEGATFYFTLTVVKKEVPV